MKQSMETSEQKIIKRCQEKDLTEFGKLYDRYIKKIYDFVYYKTHHKETAEDLVSQIFVKALENINNYNINKGSFSSWLYRIARNRVIDHYRTKKNELDICDVWDLQAEETIERDIDTKQQLEKVQQYLKKLKAEQRDIILLRVWQGLSYQEIAEITEKSQASCKMMFCRTIAKLRQEMPLSLLICLILEL